MFGFFIQNQSSRRFDLNGDVVLNVPFIHGPLHASIQQMDVET